MHIKVLNDRMNLFYVCMPWLIFKFHGRLLLGSFRNYINTYTNTRDLCKYVSAEVNRKARLGSRPGVINARSCFELTTVRALRTLGISAACIMHRHVYSSRHALHPADHAEFKSPRRETIAMMVSHVILQ